MVTSWVSGLGVSWASSQRAARSGGDKLRDIISVWVGCGKEESRHMSANCVYNSGLGWEGTLRPAQPGMFKLTGYLGEVPSMSAEL